jgi:DHA1 family tetracycline resistance protein-like MFS transporter
MNQSVHHAKTVLPVLFATLLIDTIGFGMVFPIIPIIFTDPSSPSFLLVGSSRETQLLLAGLITALFGLMQFIASPILGELSDVYGRKRLLTLGVGVLALSQLLFGFGIEVKSVVLLLIARTIAGFAAANFAIAQATIADVTTPAERAKNFGLIGAAFGIGFIVGPLLAGWLVGVTHNPAIPFWIASGLGVLNVLSVTFLLQETRPRTAIKHHFTLLKGIHNIRAALRDAGARPVYIANFLYLSGFVFFNSFIGVMLVSSFGFSAAAVGTFFGVAGICIVVTQLFILRVLTARFSERPIIRRTIPLAAAVVAIYPFAPAAAVYWLIPLFAIPQGLTMANMTALVSKSVSAEKQGAALGINSSLMALAQGLVPLAAGIGSATFGIHMPFLTGGALMLAAWFALFVFFRKRRT